MFDNAEYDDCPAE
jgi:dynein heavy chain